MSTLNNKKQQTLAVLKMHSMAMQTLIATACEAIAYCDSEAHLESCKARIDNAFEKTQAELDARFTAILKNQPCQCSLCREGKADICSGTIAELSAETAEIINDVEELKELIESFGEMQNDRR